MSANLPVHAVLAEPPANDTLCIAVDLVPATGKPPNSIGAAVQRAQDLIFANQARHAIESLAREYELHEKARCAVTQGRGNSHGKVSLIHISYTGGDNETAAKMLDYSEGSIRQRWAAGFRDMQNAIVAIEANSTSTQEKSFSLYAPHKDPPEGRARR